MNENKHVTQPMNELEAQLKRQTKSMKKFLAANSNQFTPFHFIDYLFCLNLFPSTNSSSSSLLYIFLFLSFSGDFAPISFFNLFFLFRSLNLIHSQMALSPQLKFFSSGLELHSEFRKRQKILVQRKRKESVRDQNGVVAVATITLDDLTVLDIQLK